MTTQAVERTIQDILRGCRTGDLQHAGLMTLIPLVLEDVGLSDDRFIPGNKVVIQNRSYGEVTVSVPNQTGMLQENVMILPAMAGMMTKQHAQNHSTIKSALLFPGKPRTIDTAACIQQTQGGHISHEENEIMILPWVLKELAHVVRDIKSYRKLWTGQEYRIKNHPDAKVVGIAEFNQQLGLPKDGHLERYLEKYEDDLNTFIGQFEIVPNMIGAIILMDGELVGIERAPNFNYWKSIWKALIRECYGGYALYLSRTKSKDTKSPPKTRVPLNTNSVSTLEGLEKALEKAEEKETAMVREILTKYIKGNNNEAEGKKYRFVVRPDDRFGDLSTEVIENDQFAGELVLEGRTRVHYASLFVKNAWSKMSTWNSASEFSF